MEFPFTILMNWTNSLGAVSSEQTEKNMKLKDGTPCFFFKETYVCFLHLIFVVALPSYNAMTRRFFFFAF
jgi:hypothetical protein